MVLFVLLANLTSRVQLEHDQRGCRKRYYSHATFVDGAGSPDIEDEAPAVDRVVTHKFDRHDLTSV